MEIADGYLKPMISGSGRSGRLLLGMPYRYVLEQTKRSTLQTPLFQSSRTFVNTVCSLQACPGRSVEPGFSVHGEPQDR
jgi:hypothetical protein